MSEFYSAKLGNLSISIDNTAALAQSMGADYLESTEAKLAAGMFKAMVASDPDAFGFLRDKGQPGAIVEGGRFAAMDENIAIINKFFARVFESGKRQDGTMLINGIGGQTTCSEWFLGAAPMPEGRTYMCLDSLGSPYLGKVMDELYAKVSLNAEGKTVCCIDEIDYPLVWMASSKSGGTDETMANFQSTFKMLIHLFAKVEGTDAGFASKLVDAIFNAECPTPVWQVSLEDICEKTGEKDLVEKILKKIFSVLILTTDHNPGKFNGWASRLTAFRNGPLVKALASENDIPSMHIPRDLGGRYNGIGANAVTIAAFLGHDMETINTVGRSVREKLLANDETNPLFKAAAAISCASRKLENGDKALVVVNTPALEKSAEAFVQLFPETLGKGRNSEPETLFGLFPVSRTGKQTLEGFNGKIDFFINAGTASAVNAQKDLDAVVNVNIPDTSTESITTLIMTMEYLAMMISVFNEASFHTAGGNIPQDVEGVSALIGTVKDGKWEHNPTHLAFSGALQGGVQLAKKLAQKAGMEMFNPEDKSCKATDGTTLPLRDDAGRAAWYAQRDGQFGVVTAETNAPGAEQIAQTINQTPELDEADEKLAKDLATIKAFAYKNNRVLDVWAYTERSQALDELKSYAQEKFIDILDPAPQTQHQRAQQKVEGLDATFTIILDVAKSADTVDENEEILVYDGCVPAYLHNLYPSEVGALYAAQYSSLLKGMQGCYSARIVVGDINEEASLERLKKVIDRAASLFATIA